MTDHFPKTANHDFARPDEGTLEDEWGPIINQNLIDLLEERVTVTDTDTNRSNYTPYADASFIASDTGDVHIGDGTNWDYIGTLIDPSAALTVEDDASEQGAVGTVDFGTGLTATVSSGEAAVDVVRNPQWLIESPNGTPPTALLEAGDSVEISVPVDDGETLTVYRWGGYLISDGTAPTGLDVELLDGSDTVQASSNTADTHSTAGVASYTNSSGSTSIFKLRARNATGTDYVTDGVGAVFGYEVS